MIGIDVLALHFEALHQGRPTHFSFAPGRINLLGEHIDYLGGTVLPAAVQVGISFLARFDSQGTDLSLHALDVKESVRWDSDILKQAKAPPGWQAYIWGVLKELQDEGPFWPAGDIVFSGDVPAGSGMSSSAALEVGAAFLFLKQVNRKMDNLDIAKLCQRAERLHVGTNCGIMDQFASVFGKRGHFIQLDCETLQYVYHPLKLADEQILLINSMISHDLGSDYNQIRTDLESAQSKLHANRFFDLNQDILSTQQHLLSTGEHRRARHAITEQERVSDFLEALQTNDLMKMGQLMTATHISLSRDLEVSTNQLDFLVKNSSHSPGWLGGRLMGGGFGGCTLNLVSNAFVTEYCEQISSGFKKSFGIQPEIYHVQTGAGAYLEEL